MTDQVKFTIDGIEVEAPRGELVIRVAERLGIEIPRFCDHPLLDPAGACRQCLVEVAGQRKPLTACTLTVAQDMVVKTQLTSELARDAQRGIMEFLLINHPLDCPVCDKGGECPLQNQAMSVGRDETRFVDVKRTYRKPIPISSQVLLDRERCVLCQRCTRFAEQIAGDQFIDLMERSANEQIGIYPSEPFNSYFSGNTIQICPVGALTSVQYRFRARPFDLVSNSTVCEHCAAGCAQRTDHRRGRIMRRLAGCDPAVNEEWDCDKGRFAFQYVTAEDRITEPMVRGADGELRVVSWTEALAAAADGLRRASESGGVGVLTGGRLTLEDAYAYAKFARIALDTNDIDFRARPLSTEESTFLATLPAPAELVGAAAGSEVAEVASEVAEAGPAADVETGGVTYADVERAPVAVLVGLEPEDECPILFLRLRKAHRAGRLAVYAVAPFASSGLRKLGGTLLPTVPGDEAAVLTDSQRLRDLLAAPGAVLLVGERLATVPGALSAASTLARETGAKLAWIPRRAGDRGAVEVGCLPNLLPGGRLVGDRAAAAELGELWGLADPATLPAAPGRHADAMLRAAAAGTLGGLLVAGVDPGDFADPRLARAALETAQVVVSLELRRSAVTQRADVVFPVAAAVEKAGCYLNWEGRVRAFAPALGATGALSDARVLDALAGTLGIDLGCADPAGIRQEIEAVCRGTGQRAAPAPAEVPASGQRVAHRPGPASRVLATWHQLLDLGSLQDENPQLAGTARQPVARISAGTAAELGVTDGDPVSVRTERGVITLPVAVTELPDSVVWLPTNSPGSTVPRTLGVGAGAFVEISAGGVR